MSSERLNNPLTILFLIMLVATIIRFVGFPFTMSSDGDAMARTWIAMSWIDSPHLIMSSDWGPGHAYFLAMIIALTGEPFVITIFVHMIFSLATAVVLYFITNRLFDDTRVSLLVAAAYAFYPVAMRSNYVNMPEATSVFLAAVCFLFLARARAQEGTWKDAVGAGIALTLTATFRNAVWILVPVLGLLLWGKFRLMILFWVFAMLFPLIWMTTSYIDTGEPLASIHGTQAWQLEIAGTGIENADAGEIVQRVIYHPLAVVFGITPLIAIMMLVGGVVGVFRRIPQSIWLIPPIVLAGTLLVSTIMGTIPIKARYSLIYTVFLFPFMAIALKWLLTKKWGLWLAVLLVISIIPLSSLGNVLPSGMISRFFEVGVNAFPVNIDDAGQETVQTAQSISDQIGDDDGVVSDFFGYERTPYVLYETHLNPSRIYLAPGEENQPREEEKLEAVLENYGRGILLIQETSRFAEIIGFSPEVCELSILDQRVQLEEILVFEQLEEPLYM